MLKRRHTIRLAIPVMVLGTTWALVHRFETRKASIETTTEATLRHAAETGHPGAHVSTRCAWRFAGNFAVVRCALTIDGVGLYNVDCDDHGTACVVHRVSMP